MHTIKNTSSKIINIDTGIVGKRFAIVMPDQAVKVTDAAAKTPAVKALAKRKMLEIIAPAAPVQEQAPVGDEQDVKDDGQQETTGEGSGEDKAPEAPKGARRTTKKPESKE